MMMSFTFITSPSVLLRIMPACQERSEQLVKASIVTLDDGDFGLAYSRRVEQCSFLPILLFLVHLIIHVLNLSRMRGFFCSVLSGFRGHFTLSIADDF